MTFYMFYEEGTGRPISSSLVIPPRVTSGVGIKEFANPPLDSEMWDEETLEFVPRPAKLQVDRIDEFMSYFSPESFSQVQREKIVGLLVEMLGDRRFRNYLESFQING